MLAGTLAALLAVALVLELRPDWEASVRPVLPVLPFTHAARPEPAQTTDALLIRPLFAPNRRLAAATVVSAAPIVPTVAPHLVGVVASGAGRHAVFALGDGRAMVAARGQRVDGFLVREVAPDAVTLDGENGEQVLRLAFARPGGASSAPAAPPTALLAPEPSGPEAPGPAAARGVPGGPASSALPGRPS